MHSIEVILIMMLAVIASSYIVRMLPFSLPVPLVQIALGIMIASITDQEVTLDPAVFFLLFLPPLLFLDGWRIPKEGLFRDRTMILELALGLVLLTVIGIGFLIHWMIPTMSLPVAFALAAIVSPTDPVAVSAIAARVPIPKRLMHILEGESLLNDATGLVCFRFAVAAAVTGHFSLTSASLTFLWVAFAGLVIGVVVTWSVSLAQRGLSLKFGEDSGSPILINLLIPFGAYLIAEEVHASGILAAVSAGITMSYVELSGRALATTRIQRTTVWNTVQFSLNGIVFVLLGEQFPEIWRSAVSTVQQSHKEAGWLIAYALVINLGLAVLRFSWVWVSFHWGLWRARKRGKKNRGYPHWRLVAATSLAGVRGAITLAGIMTLPLTMPDGTAFPDRNLAIFLAMAVIVLSLLAASLLLPWLLNGLELPLDRKEEKEEDLARYESAKAALIAIEKKQHALVTKMPEEAELYAHATTRAMAMYQQRVDNMNTEIDTEQLQRAEQAERELWQAGLRSERAHIFMMARERRISDKTARRLVGEIDLIETRLEEHSRTRST
ncbi:Na+/H+ antiporter [uncultured Legionella sp.]|uniref:Na+/H+ antiporter n=1 Tax=uncultured Legionella sp. TaxID=210934 RepID=UPI00260D4243|nr:Na+/H+ antiporter [uncultured Legionella sp.]